MNTPEDIEQRLQRLERLAQRLDSQFRIPMTPIRVGADSILGLIPGIGDTATALISLYIWHEARQMKVPLPTQLRMLWNIFVDWLIGTIPLIGDLFDVGWKANLRNVRLIRQHFQRNGL